MDSDSFKNPMFDAWLDYQKQMVGSAQPAFQGGPFKELQRYWPASELWNNSSDNGAYKLLDSLMKSTQHNWDDWQKQVAQWVATSASWGDKKSQTEKSPAGSYELLQQIMDPMQYVTLGLGELGNTIRHMVEGPAFSDVGIFERHGLQSTQEWLALQQAYVEYYQIIGAGWKRAFDQFNADTTGDDGAMKAGPRALADRWLSMVNDELINTQRTEEYLSAQQLLVRCGANYRLKLREITEFWCESNSLPTRTEVDELQATVTELRREVRRLKKQVSATSLPEAVVKVVEDHSGSESGEASLMSTDSAAVVAGTESLRSAVAAPATAVTAEQLDTKKTTPTKKAAKKKVVSKKAVAKKVVAKKAVTKKAGTNKASASKKVSVKKSSSVQAADKKVAVTQSSVPASTPQTAPVKNHVDGQ